MLFLFKEYICAEIFFFLAAINGSEQVKSEKTEK